MVFKWLRELDLMGDLHLGRWSGYMFRFTQHIIPHFVGKPTHLTHQKNTLSSAFYLVAGVGFEPATFGL